MFFSYSKVKELTKCFNDSIRSHKTVAHFCNKIRMQHKIQYTLGERFFVYGYSDPNRGINQSKPAYYACYIIIVHAADAVFDLISPPFLEIYLSLIYVVKLKNNIATHNELKRLKNG